MIEHIMFDFDGTLVDTGGCVVSAFQMTLRKYGYSEKEEVIILSLIGLPLEKMFLSVGVKEIEIPLMMKTFREIYGEIHLSNYQLYTDVKVILHDLVKAGRKLYIITSKPKHYVDEILKEEELEELFEEVSGVSLDPYTDTPSKGKRIGTIMDQYDIDKNQACYVGDTISDYRASSENELRCLIVPYGYGDMENLIAVNGDNVLSGFSDILKII